MFVNPIGFQPYNTGLNSQSRALNNNKHSNNSYFAYSSLNNIGNKSVNIYFKGNKNKGNNRENENLLHAAWAGNVEKMERAIARGADINAQDEYGDSVVHKACSSKYNTEPLEFLLAKRNINLNVQNKYGATPLHDVTGYDDNRLANLLLADERIDVNIQDLNGETPIMDACNAGNKELFEALLNHPDIDIDIKNKSGRTVSDYLFTQGLIGIGGINYSLNKYAMQDILNEYKNSERYRAKCQMQ